MPIPTITSTSGYSLALRLRARSAISTVSETFLFHAVLFLILLRERLYYADRSKHFLHDGDDLTFFLPNFARGFLDASRKAINNDA